MQRDVFDSDIKTFKYINILSEESDFQDVKIQETFIIYFRTLKPPNISAMFKLFISFDVGKF